MWISWNFIFCDFCIFVLNLQSGKSFFFSLCFQSTLLGVYQFLKVFQTLYFNFVDYLYCTDISYSLASALHLLSCAFSKCDTFLGYVLASFLLHTFKDEHFSLSTALAVSPDIWYIPSAFIIQFKLFQKFHYCLFFDLLCRGVLAQFWGIRVL